MQNLKKFSVKIQDRKRIKYVTCVYENLPEILKKVIGKRCIGYPNQAAELGKNVFEFSAMVSIHSGSAFKNIRIEVEEQILRAGV